MTKAIIAVPCYNEAKRIDAPAFRRFLDAPGVDLLFVNDGSTDDTAAVLGDLCASLGDRASVLDLPRNVGKAEAVRRGMLWCLDAGAADVTGYYDADLATPPEEMVRLLQVLGQRGVDVALASRVQLLGTRIERWPVRHYTGRVFATFSSLVLKMPVYDTQCGAKAFRAGPALRNALKAPFHSRWGFDVELLGRLHRGSPGTPGLPLEAFAEMPLAHWRDVPGSKLRSTDFPKALVELVRIRAAIHRWTTDGAEADADRPAALTAETRPGGPP